MNRKRVGLDSQLVRYEVLNFKPDRTNLLNFGGLKLELKL